MLQTKNITRSASAINPVTTKMENFHYKPSHASYHELTPCIVSKKNGTQIAVSHDQSVESSDKILSLILPARCHDSVLKLVSAWLMFIF